MTNPGTYMVSIPLEVVNATHRGGYYELFLKFRNEGMTMFTAWSRTESELAAYGLAGRYSSFESFRVSSRYEMRSELKKWRARMSQPITFPI